MYHKWVVWEIVIVCINNIWWVLCRWYASSLCVLKHSTGLYFCNRKEALWPNVYSLTYLTYWVALNFWQSRKTSWCNLHVDDGDRRKMCEVPNPHWVREWWIMPCLTRDSCSAIGRTNGMIIYEKQEIKWRIIVSLLKPTAEYTYYLSRPVR